MAFARQADGGSNEEKKSWKEGKPYRENEMK